MAKIRVDDQVFYTALVKSLMDQGQMTQQAAQQAASQALQQSTQDAQESDQSTQTSGQMAQDQGIRGSGQSRTEQGTITSEHRDNDIGDDEAQTRGMVNDTEKYSRNNKIDSDMHARQQFGSHDFGNFKTPEEWSQRQNYQQGINLHQHYANGTIGLAHAIIQMAGAMAFAGGKEGASPKVSNVQLPEYPNASK